MYCSSLTKALDTMINAEYIKVIADLVTVKGLKVERSTLDMDT